MKNEPYGLQHSVRADTMTEIDKLRASEQQLRLLFNSGTSGIYLLDSNYDIMMMNNYGRRMLQLINDDIKNVKTNFLLQLPQERRTIVQSQLDSAFEGRRSEYEVLYRKTNGSDLWLLVTYAPVKDADGKINSVCLVANNITSLKNKEKDLLKSEQRWKFALDGAGDGVWEYNFQTKESYYSPLYKAMLGYSEDEFKNEEYEWLTRVHPDDLPKVQEINRKYFKEGLQSHALEYRLKNKANEYVWVLDRGTVLEKTPDGQPLKIVGTHKNVTGRKLAEATLRESQQRFSSFMNNAPTMSWIIDEHDIFRYLNKPYMEAFNLTPDDVGKSIHEIFPPKVCKAFIENNWKVWRENKSIEVIEEGVSVSGEQQFYQIFKFPLAPENGVNLLGGVALDITKKLRTEQQLLEEEAKKKREIIQANINAQERERKELAYELHDNVNQILTSSKLMLEVAAERPELAADFVNRSLIYLNQAISEIRKISHSLTPGTLSDISLEAAVGEVIQTIVSTGKLRINYENDPGRSSAGIAPEVQLSLLRIVQEQLNNILKHAAATEATVLLNISTHHIQLTISDNGKGFNPQEVKKGLGLHNITNRVHYYHGNIKIVSSPGCGCSLHVEIPVGTH